MPDAATLAATETASEAIAADLSNANDPARLDWGRAGLSARSRAILFSAAEAIYSDEDDDGQIFVPATGICERAVNGVDLMIGNGSADLPRGFALFTFFLQMLPVFFIGRLSRMTKLSLAERVDYLRALEHSRVGLIVMLLVAIKVPMTMSAFEEGVELASTGFDRPNSVARRRLPVTRSAPTKQAAPRTEVTQ